ncbi:hypothetical protein ACS7SF_10635 [Ralstonia sp. 25C]|uniref:hypothetical protein n=1 Tax=Ralstonia sp. 25C TaxID=3447363 RepID=UPI003F74DC81
MDAQKLDVLRLSNERDIERMKGELSSARAELEAFKSGLIQQVADAKVQIGDQAVEKMSKAFAEFRLWAGLCILLGGALVGLSAYQIYSVARQTIETKITDWLSFDKKGALLKESLEDIRMRVVLDGLVTRMARSSISGAYRGHMDLSVAEKSRLVAYMLAPDTSEMDFRDGARILGAHVGIFYAAADSKLDELLEKTMARFQADSYRPRVLLENLQRYQGTGQYANRILATPDVPNDLRYAAFSALSNLFGEAAKKYALTHLSEEQYVPLQVAEVKFLADEQSAVSLVDQWLAKKSSLGEGIEARVMLADSLASRISFTTFDNTNQTWITERVSNLMVSAISKGAKLNYSDTFYPRVDVGFKTDGKAQFHQPESLFEGSKKLLSAMAKAASSSNVPPEIFIRALTTKGRRGEIFGVRVVMNSAALVGEAFGVIDSTTAAGSLLLIADDRATVPYIQVSFRAKDGRWIDDRVKSFKDFYNADLSFAYDETVIQLARSRNLQELQGLYD